MINDPTFKEPSDGTGHVVVPDALEEGDIGYSTEEDNR